MAQRVNPADTFNVQPYIKRVGKAGSGGTSVDAARFFQPDGKTRIQMTKAEMLHVPTVAAVEGLVVTTKEALLARIGTIDGKMEAFSKDMVGVVNGISDRAPTRAEYDQLKVTVEEQAERIAQLEAQIALVLKQVGGSDVNS